MLHQIGAGALGPVFRAYDPEKERLVAVKMFRLDLPPEQVHRLEAELEALVSSHLSHPALAQPLRAGRTGVCAYLAEEFVAAESLDIVVRDSGPARFDEVLRLGTHLAGALDLSAAAGVFHGTLHPRDVLLSSDAIRLTGIGVAQALERIGQPAPVRRPYSAPERQAGAVWDRRADVFSLATLMHEMLWAKRVNGLGPQAAEALTAIEGADLDRLRLTFAQALAEDPAHRFATALEFVDVLRDATAVRHIHGVPASIGAPEDTPVPKPKSPRRASEVSALLRGGRPDPNAMPLFQQAAAEPATVVGPAIAATAEPLASAPPGESLEASEVDHALPPPIVAPAGDPESVEVEIEHFAEESTLPNTFDAPPEEPATISTAPAPFSRIDDDHDRFDDYRSSASSANEANVESFEHFENAANVEHEAIAEHFATDEHFANDEPLVSSGNLTNSEPLVSAEIPESSKYGANPEPIDSPEHAATSQNRVYPTFQLRPRGVLTAPEVTVEPEEEESALSRGFMPLVLALIVGLGIGFAAGYGIGSNAGAGQSEGRSAAAIPPAAPLTPDAPRPAAPPVDNATPPSEDGRSASAPPTPAVVPPAAKPKPAPPAPAPADAGRIVVRSTPSNALVLLDGREVGRTPYTARDVSRGAHVVRIVRDGYQSAERRVTVSASEPSRTISVKLARNAPERAPAAAAAAARTTAAPSAASAATTGSLYIESRPTQASVTIDGKPSGTTPMLLDGLEPGDHTIRLVAPDHQPLTQSVRIVAGQRSRVAVSLER